MMVLPMFGRVHRISVRDHINFAHDRFVEAEFFQLMRNGKEPKGRRGDGVGFFKNTLPTHYVSNPVVG